MIGRKLTRFYRRGRASAVKPHIYQQLVAALFSPTLSVFVAAALCIGAIGALSTLRTSDQVLAVLSAIAVSMGLVRAGLIARFRSKVRKFSNFEQARRWERYWAIASLAYAATVGTMAARGIASTDDPVVHLVVALGAVGTAGVVAVAAVRPNIVIGQLLALFIPLIAGVFMQDNPYYWALAVVGGPFVLMISEMTYSLYETAVRALKLASGYGAMANQLRERNARFDTALSNMAQGLCMFDAELTLTVCNQRFIELYGLSAEVVKPGTTLQQLVEHSVSRGNHPGWTPRQLHEMWLTQASRNEEALLHQTLGDGRTLAIHHRPMAGGGYVGTIDDITEQKRAAEQVSHLARHDVLTDLPNRLYLRERLEADLAGLKAGERLAVMCLDLDDFKTVNDTQGHPAGDALLVQVSQRLQHMLAPEDFLARLGGDEFALIVHVDRNTGGLAKAEAVIEALSRSFWVQGREANIGASIGIAVATEHGSDADTLLKRADIALYQAKAEGRRTARLFDPAMAQRLIERRDLESELRRALADSEFELYYQPQINIVNGSISTFEALVRWRHPRRGLLTPDMFIPLAEETGLIVPLGEWVLRHACAEAAEWPEQLRVAVNLSPVQFRSKGLVETIARALADSGLPPERLELEITEGVLLHDDAANLAALGRLREMRVRIAMDDFGTGYSSLSYLRSFRFDKVKIDKSFVSGPSGGAEGAAIIRAVMSLCTTLGIATSVEGVESEEQLDRIRAEGCTEVQGYLFSKPVPPEDLPGLFPATFLVHEAAA